MRRILLEETASAASTDEAGLSYDDYEGAAAEGEDAASRATEALAIVLTLIALTVLFERMKHRAEHRAGRALRHVVEALFGELTVLGFLSMVTYLLERSGFFLALSRWVKGETAAEDSEGEEEPIFELVETIHFAMFFVMVIFLVSVLYELHHGLQSQKEWNQWDRACHDELYVEKLLRENAASDAEYDAVSSMPGLRGLAARTRRLLLPYFRFLPFLNDSRHEDLEDKMEFCSLRLEFFKERSAEPPFPAAGEPGAHQKTIGDHFNFGRYLTHVYAKKMAHVVEIDVTTWLIFAGGTVGYFLLFDFLGFEIKELAWVWVLIGWFFHVSSINFEKYLLEIRDGFIASQFVPEPKRRKLSWGSINSTDDDSVVDGTEKQPLQKLSDGLPAWCYIDLSQLDRSRSKLSKIIFGPTPKNRQHALYLFGPEGPEIHLLCLRVMLVFSCVYSAQLIILFVPVMARNEGARTLAVYCFLAFGPALAFIFNKKRLIALVVQVGCIGPFVLPQAVSESEREEKMSVAVRVLVLYFKLANMAKKFLASPENFWLPPTDCHYNETLSEEERADLGRTFTKFFDRDCNGWLNGPEFRKLLATAGIDLTCDEADQLIGIMATSAEIPGRAISYTGDKAALSKDLFLQWYSNLLSVPADDKKECAHFLFHLFDDDNSGDVTVMEFKQRLDTMNIGISHEDADELLQEMDEDGNGVLSEEEFESLIDHFYPVEYQHRSESMNH